MSFYRPPWARLGAKMGLFGLHFTKKKNPVFSPIYNNKKKALF